MDHNLVVTGASSLASEVQIGGGYGGGSGVTITDAGGVSMNENLLVGGLTTLIGNLNARSGIDIGTGYGSLPNQTGATITAAGELSMDLNLVIGGGYGKTGSTLTSYGGISMDHNLVVTGTSSFTGASSLASEVQIGGGYGGGSGVTITDAGSVQANE